MRISGLLTVGALLLVMGCDFGNKVCPSIVEPAVVVEVRNAATDAPEAQNADGILVEGSYIDTMHVKTETKDGIPLALAGGMGRAGTYAILIEKTGFKTWMRAGVHVDDGTCGPETETLTARIEPIE
jgi:hypothetical protein